jgi:hypothetical protein
VSNWQILQALVFEPRKAFAELAEQPRFWFPLLLLAIGSTVVAVWYLSVVDFPWMMDQQLRGGMFGRQLTEEQITTAVRAASDRRGVQIAITGIFSPLGIALAMMLAALLSLLSAKLTNVKYGYRQWLALACWCNVPTLLAQVASAIVLLTTTTAQISQGDLQPLSLNSLIFHKDATASGYTALTYITVLHLWTMVLSVYGVKLWSNRSWLFSFLFACWPGLLVLGIWALVVLT